MKNFNQAQKIIKQTNWRWVICSLLFFATTINYLDRQLLSLTWKDFIAPEFHWTDANYGTITGFFSLFYAAVSLVAGRFIDWMGSRKGYLWAIFVWSLAAVMHAGCGWATMKIEGVGSIEALKAVEAGSALALSISTVSVYLFLGCRALLAVGESGNFPAAIKVTAQYFPKKDRAFATAVFNSGASIGALVAPLCIPLLAKMWGWEMAFVIIGALGFVWMGFWAELYTAPDKSKHVSPAELAYINQDEAGEPAAEIKREQTKTISFWRCFTFRQTWAFIAGKAFTDGVWWFFLFWTPAYISDVYGFSSDSPTAQLLIFVLYAITMLSIYGGKLPTIIINRTGKNPYAARMQAMFIFALFPLLALLAQPLGSYSYWFPIIIIGIAGAAHQSWSANIFSVVGDMFPNTAVATITGIGGMAGGLGSFLINKCSGTLFDYSDATQMVFMGFQGKEAGYFIIFCVCAVAYLIGWCIMKALVPKYRPVVVE